MAKQVIDTASVRKGASPFGSHKTMLDSGGTEKVSNKANLEGKVDPDIKFENSIYVVCRDEDMGKKGDDEGLYVTERRRLDDKMTDPFRIASKEWRQQLLAVMSK